ncbi:Glucose-methanol-choline oxidoreductase [gamma proteobacterium HdN1]|nr:Glucose-methanol-choline oxidoreductase [gamma proteobacterium HdN1]
MQAVEEFDFIVIGGGSAGCIAAARIADANLGSVLLVEAGDAAEENPETLLASGFAQAFANENTLIDRLSIQQPRCAKRTLYMGSGTGMGGSGAVNGMVYTRGDRRDYAQWPEGWRWENVAPSFDALEHTLGVSTRNPNEFTNTCLDAALQSGFERKDELNDGELCGHIGYQLMNYHGGDRRHAYSAFIKGFPRENLTVLTRTRLERIEFDENMTAIAVHVRQRSAMQEIVRRIGLRKEIILCAGALETPKLLMLSGVGPSNQLRHFGIEPRAEVPAVGRNLQDHPNVCIFYRGNSETQSFYPQVYGFERMNPALALADQQADTCFVFYSAASSLAPSMQRMLPALMLPASQYGNRRWHRWIRNTVTLAFRLPFLQRFVNKVYGIVVILGKPSSRGEVTLASADPAHAPRINPGYFLNSDDLDTLTNGVIKAQQIAGQPALTRWGNQGLSLAARSTDREKIKQWIKQSAMTTFHYAGTCKMGTHPSDPVDTQLRLKAARNVRIADASVIPEIPVAAINAPSMMIGWRVADFIIEEIERAQLVPAPNIASASDNLPAEAKPKNSRKAASKGRAKKTKQARSRRPVPTL